MRGTPLYMAPELKELLNRRSHGKYNPLAADIYSIGLILLEMLLGQSAIEKIFMT